MNAFTEPKRYFLIPALLGAALSYGVLTLVGDDDEGQREQIAALENRILDLELSLVEKEEALARARSLAFAGFEQHSSAGADNSGNPPGPAKVVPTEPASQMLAGDEVAVAADQIARDLSTQSDRDPRSFTEKVNDLLAAAPSQENIAIVSKTLSDMAENPQILPDYELESLYQQQANPELKRVIAQVLSARGDNRLIEKQINDTKAGLGNANPAERQKALVELAKTRHASAANTIAPLLQDADTGVKLDALLALRATGNQSHVHLVEALVNHPDPAVSWLAKDVINSLQNLSERARTRIASADIVAELPAF